MAVLEMVRSCVNIIVVVVAVAAAAVAAVAVVATARYDTTYPPFSPVH